MVHQTEQQQLPQYHHNPLELPLHQHQQQLQQGLEKEQRQWQEGENPPVDDDGDDDEDEDDDTGKTILRRAKARTRMKDFRTSKKNDKEWLKKEAER